MGLFGSKDACGVCGGKIGIGHIKCKDGLICSACFKKCTPNYTGWQSLSAAEIADHIQARERNASEFAAFSATDTVGKLLWVDRKNKRWCCPMSDSKSPDIFNFSDIVNFELSEDGITQQGGGAGAAAAGGLLFGGAGAIVGGNLGRKNKAVCSSMALRITVNSPLVFQVVTRLISTDTAKTNPLYKLMKDQGMKAVSLLEAICSATVPEPVAAGAGSIADEIKKLKDLMDAGAITPDEFAAAKAKLL